MARVFWLLILAWHLLPAPPSLADEEAKILVGGHGDIQRLDIRGTRTFTPEDVKRALSWNWQTMLAAHPSADMFEYAEVLRQKARIGYLHEGFPDVEASVNLDLDTRCLVLTIEEGPRFTAADVDVTGLKTIPADKLIQRLTEPYPPKDAVAEFEQTNGKTSVCWVDRDGKKVDLREPVWQSGTPAPFAEITRNRLRNKVKEAFSGLGHHFARFELQVVADRAEQTARLQVDVIDEGPKATIGAIEINGNRKNSDQDVCRYLDVEVGKTLDRDEYLRITRLLRRSGRFIESKVTPMEPASEDDSILLRIDLTEYDPASPLTEALSPDEEVLLKLRDWLANTDRWEGDLLATVRFDEETQLEVAVSPEHGAVAVLGGPDDAEGFDLALVAGRERVGLYSASNHAKLEGDPGKGELSGSISLKMVEKPDDAEQPYRSNLAFSLSVNSEDKLTEDLPFRLSIQLDSCAFIAMAHEHQAKHELREGVLTVESDLFVWQVDTQSGRLIEFSSHSKEQRAKGDPPGVKIAFQKEAFSRQLQRIESLTAGFPNRFDPQWPVTTSLQFLCRQELLERLPVLEPEHKRALRVASLLAEKRVLQPLDEFAVWLFTLRPRDERFTIPDEFGGSIDSFLKIMAARIALSASDRVFMRDTWPWTVWRETALVVAGDTQHTGKELDKLYNSDAGPLCCLLVAKLLQRGDHPAAKAFAGRGLERLSLEHFRNDCRVLLDEYSLFGKCAVRFVEAFRDMEEQDVEVLRAEMNRETAVYFRQAEWILRRQRETPIEVALPELLDAAWEGGLRETAKLALEDVIDPPLPQQ